MDCGPAALQCLLAGFGLRVSYERLREACQTDVDGTSIDAIELVANELGLEAEQVMLPVDHLLLPEFRALPALLVVKSGVGATHFVVVWRRVGEWVQVMDPASGRRWMRAAALREEIFVHSLPVSAAAWREWAASAESQAALDRRLERLGIAAEERRRLLAAGREAAGWQPLAALDAAIRLVATLIRAKAVARGKEARRLVEEWTAVGLEVGPAEGRGPHSRYWSVVPVAEGPAGGEDEANEERILLRGAVLLRVLGRRAGGTVEEESAPVREWKATLAQPQVRAGRELVALLSNEGRLGPVLLLTALGVAAAGTVLEILFFRGLLGIGLRVRPVEQRLAILGLLVVFLLLLLLLERAIFGRLLRFGHNLELRLRVRFLRKVARLGDGWFRSRLRSDLAERSHSVHRLRLLPELVGTGARVTFQLLITAGAIAWLSPPNAAAVVLALLASLAIPWLAQAHLGERDLRVRSHLGGLARFYLEAMQGLVPLRAHGGEAALRREHEALLVKWVRSFLRLERSALAVEVVQAVVGYGLAGWIVLRHLSTGGGGGEILLIAYWALQLQMQGQRLVILGRQIPGLRNVAVRLLEPLGAEERERSPEARAEIAEAAARHDNGVALRLERVAVVVAGHAIIEDVDLEIEGGSRVGIVGPSGAGKSTLLGVLLGWHRPVAGRVYLDGKPISDGDLEALRLQTAWVDPAVQIWNRSLLDNLVYGVRKESARPLGEVTKAAELRPLIESLPGGLQTRLGEDGGLVSGGEGQRVRIGRVFSRPDARLVLLDEPFRGLDRPTRSELLARALRWWPKATVLVVTHDISETADLDRVVVVEKGRIVEAGSPAALMERPDSRYRHFRAEEAVVRGRLARDPSWRRLHLERGRLEG